MSTYTLPNDFLPSNTPLPALVFHDYRRSAPVHQAQIQLRYHLISFLEEGTKIVWLPERQVEVPAQHFLCLGAGNCLMTETLSCRAQYRSRLLLFESALLQDFLAKYQVSVPFQTDYSTHQVGVSDAYLRHFVEALALLPPGRAALLRIKLEELLLYIYEQYGAAFFACWELPASPEQQQVMKVVQQAIGQRLTVEQMAFLCQMSVSTFKRKFAEQYEDSPYQWLREQRLQRALTLLQQGHCRPSEVFHQVGFDHLSSFTQAFKKRFGTLPSSIQGAAWPFRNSL